MPTRRPRPNPSGIHLLRSTSVLRAIVRAADLSPADHVFDLGAGPGTLTAALARTGARVTAVERDPLFARELRRRFARFDRVAVAEADLRRVRIPRRAKVVSNLPFSTSTALLGRLLDPPGPPRAEALLLVERGFAMRVAEPLPRSSRLAWWAARYELRILRTVPRTAFAPPPAVEGALLRIRSREPFDREAEGRLRRLLAAAYESPQQRAATIARRFAGRRAGPALLRAAGTDPHVRACEVAPPAWAEVARGRAVVR